MGRRVAATVRVESPQGEHVILAPGDEVPDWATGQVTNGDALAPEGTTGVVADGDGAVTGVVTGDAGAATSDGAVDYEAMTVAALRDLIQERNEGRDEADLIPTEGRKGDLVDALEADDEA